MTNSGYERESVLRALQRHDSIIESLEQALSIAHESRREFVNRHDLNKCGSCIECKGCQDDDAHAHMVD